MNTQTSGEKGIHPTELRMASPIHSTLRTLIQDEKGRQGEMSARPRIARAIEKLLDGRDLQTIPEDVLLMHRIAGYVPTSPAPQIHRIYDESLSRLAKIMGAEKLYGGEVEWTKKMMEQK